MPILKAVNSDASLQKTADYIERKAALRTARYCSSKSAMEEMEITRAYYGKPGGRAYYHYVLSFNPKSKITAEECAEITKKVVDANPLLDGHEVEIAVHTDSDHTHAHILINSVRATDGKKLHMSKKEYRKWIMAQQIICQRYGYKPEKKKDRNRGDFIANDRKKYEVVSRKGKTSDIVATYQAIGYARSLATDWKEFKKLLLERSVSVEMRPKSKHIVFSYGGHMFRETNLAQTFSDNISKEELEDEFLRNKRERDERLTREEHERINAGIREREQSFGRVSSRIGMPVRGTTAKTGKSKRTFERTR